MYDVLYTRAPINYSGTSFVRRAICFLCLACSLCGFAILFRHADVQIFKILVSRKYDKKVDISITYLLLAGAITLELYALLTILCSDWSVLYLIKEQRNKFVDAALQVFAHKVSRPPRWSNQIQQLNMLHYCISKEPTVLNKILNKLIRRIPKNTPCAQLLEGWDQRYKRFRLTQSVGVDDTLKELIIKQIEEVRGQRVWQAFTKRGEWALERYKCLDQFKWSIGTDHTNEANQQTSFGRAITIWHLATDVCYGRESSESKSTNKELSKRLSDYMMYLLAVRPHMLSIGTGSILFQGASKKLGEFLSVIISSPTDAATKKGKTDEKTMIQHFLEKLLQKSSEETVVRVSNKHNNVEISAESEYVIISSWNLVLDAKLLSELLIDREDKWSLLCSIWTEMLFYAASNCPWVHHTEQLRRGGGLITFAWILLNHETNKFNISMY
ncbi:hypothetical protein JCGZ_10221 [Jatropha curcas]|uniref:DUF4220 domain-containing protein n=2 Tax=Jatropha curcas TaxID=180498 RepID=A0A067LD22_JATCU|nr:hypothetical protein JCGZ_10221 [Jatropha curcas]